MKDAYGRTDVTRREFEEHLDSADDRGMEMITVDLPDAQRMVAGAMRLSVQNGFRLPRRADRWASVIGVTGYADADLKDFEKPDGKYRYVGSMQDLRKRLTGGVEEFLQRKDVAFVVGQESPFGYELEDQEEGGWTPAEYGDDEEDEDDDDEAIDEADVRRELFEKIEEICDRAYVAIYNWLIGAGQTPNPLLREGIDVALVAALLQSSVLENSDEVRPAPDLSEALAQYDDPDAVVAAAGQVVEYMQQFDSPQRMLEALGFGGDSGLDLTNALPLPPR
jgi:hypothetical protein